MRITTRIFMKTENVEKIMVELIRLWASTHNKFVDRFKYLYFCELDNRKVLDFYMSATELTRDEQEKIEDFYENWVPGKVMDIPHVAGQVKANPKCIR